ncbi:MAG: BTAD domain-containing putative transcriptional regulator, partial [Bacteroidota bacterium]
MNNSSKLFVKCLGFPQIQYQGQAIEPSTLKSQALFIYLLVESIIQPEQKIPREKLTDLLWPGMTLSSALQNLRQSLYQIRKALSQLDAHEGEWIVADRKTLSLHPEAPLALDVAPLLSAAAIPLHSLADLNPVENLFLDNFYIPDSPAFDAWVDQIRHRLRNQYKKELESRVQENQSQEKWEPVQHYAGLLIKAEPLQETYYRWQMQALHKLQKNSQAIRVYKELESIFKQELGSQPGAESQGLYRALQNQEIIPKKVPAQTQLKKRQGFSLRSRIYLGLVAGALALLIILFFLDYFNPPARDLPKSIAVLPFENTNDQDYIVSGLSDGIIEQLTRFPELKVISYYSSSRYTTDHPELSEIA